MIVNDQAGGRQATDILFPVSEIETHPALLGKYYDEPEEEQLPGFSHNRPCLFAHSDIVVTTSFLLQTYSSLQADAERKYVCHHRHVQVVPDNRHEYLEKTCLVPSPSKIPPSKGTALMGFAFQHSNTSSCIQTSRLPRHGQRHDHRLTFPDPVLPQRALLADTFPVGAILTTVQIIFCLQSNTKILF